MITEFVTVTIFENFNVMSHNGLRDTIDEFNGLLND